MAKICIMITGIALSYQKDNLWKVLFPFDDCHNIKLLYYTKDVPVMVGSLASAKRRIEIRAASTISTLSVGNYYGNFIDLTGNYAHDGGLDLMPDWNDRGILLSIQNALFRLCEFTNTKCVLREKTSITNPIVFGPEVVGYSAMAHIEIGQQDSVDLVQIDDGVETVIQKFDSDAILWFDNNCEEDFEMSDTYLLYNLVKGKGADSREFSSERDPDDKYVPLPDFSSKSLDFFKSILNTENPAVAIEGVPCHKFTASKSDNLP